MRIMKGYRAGTEKILMVFRKFIRFRLVTVESATRRRKNAQKQGALQGQTENNITSKAELETSTYIELNKANYAYGKMYLLPAYIMDKSQHITYQVSSTYLEL
jgi:hypothetical protein